ncbi:flagellar biosynthetic protein FliO [Paenibacillus sp. JX-17]|uniref:Flagellar biosynthetic protein FliO n=1 Tax=Paenibacillus lacisoli TaxID=3064525 RepID=A0ABT9C9A3_9BACL|nr:flagellar biosynthetic protein FliO [Paenibacillus sp. JX-17]MDO7905821.1 flagellar biosynthetic protein FliO [Paenibacillus sp. JX-17]
MDTSSIVWNIITVIIVLAVIIVLIVYLIRFLSRKNNSWFSNRSVRILGGVGLGPNKSLQIIEIGSSIYLVGVGEDINLVDKVSDPEEVQLIVSLLEQEAASQRGALPPLVAKLASRLRKEQPAQDIELEDSSSFHEMFESKLKRMPDRREKLEQLRKEDNTTDRSRDS